MCKDFHLPFPQGSPFAALLNGESCGYKAKFGNFVFLVINVQKNLKDLKGMKK
jgi:hypothetical protein